MLTIHRSNSLPSLADALAEVQRANPLPPLVAEPIIVQSPGMKRWLSFALAERLGVAANVAFHFPAGFVAQLFAAVLPDAKPGAVFDREVLPWRVLAVLPPLLARPEFAQLAQYVDGENRALKTFQLASQIARVMDRYLAFRARMILDWHRGGEGWQPILWRAVAQDELHMPALAERFRSRARESAGKLPPRFSIFGAASLGPFFLDALTEAAHHTEAHLFLLTPTPEYWGDIASEKTIARLRKKSPATAAHSEQGHPLLASFGKVGRDFFDAVAAIEGAREYDYFTPPAADTTLARIQRDIFDLSDADKHPFSADDTSIRLHTAHSPLREIEILHDHMLAWFERGITPRDVLVMMPDVETYAPFIEAVFSTPESPRTRIPFRIADRAASRDNTIAQAFLSLLALAGSRFTASDVLALLDLAPVRARFGIAETDLPLIRAWAARAGIRWGKDAAHRGACDVPAFAENSWRAGLDRLLLGFALPGDGETLYAGILPEPVAEGSAAKTLGAFAQFITTLFEKLDALAAPRTAADWTPTLRALLDAFTTPDDDFADDRREVSAHLGAIADHATHAGHDAPIPFEIIRAHLAAALAGTDRAGTGFLSGGVTFCSMKPMRSIPHRVIAMLGLDGDKFPRHDRPPQFDLVAGSPQPGDRSTRDDDRQIFLDAILAARDVLYLSHVGLSAKDNAPLPPSTVVAELLAHLDAAFTSPDEKMPSAHITTAHPLQAFSPRAFTAPLFSFSQENARACVAASAVRNPRGPLVATPLPAPEIARELPLERLAQCLAHPVKFFARANGISLPGDEADADDTEPLKLDGLDKYRLTENLTAAALAGNAATEAALRASGTLPPAYPGLDTFRTADAEARRFARRVQTLAPAPLLPPLTVTVAVDDWRITDALTDARATGLVFARPADSKAKDFLRAWLAHLVLCAAVPDGIELRTLIIGKAPKSGPGEFEFTTPADPPALLRDILAFYRTAHCEPLRFFPECALAFTETTSPKDPLTAAQNEWSNDTGWSRTESDDDWNAFFFAHEPQPLDETFEHWAKTIFAPMLTHRTALEKPKPAKRK